MSKKAFVLWFRIMLGPKARPLYRRLSQTSLNSGGPDDITCYENGAGKREIECAAESGIYGVQRWHELPHSHNNQNSLDANIQSRLNCTGRPESDAAIDLMIGFIIISIQGLVSVKKGSTSVSTVTLLPVHMLDVRHQP